ncbi:MAG: hypothetical protein GY894_02895 [Planctomycetes bacterium]|nr:hypothetical protein [Planctomycetota bacterium]MCP4838297.1 hypothetical protein [Planctomycetota bacterium]
MRIRSTVAAVLGLSVIGLSVAAVVDMTLEDFYVPGTQVGDVEEAVIWESMYCDGCHDPSSTDADPISTWRGSLMANAGRDPLFFAQMTNANQDVAEVGYFCLRCHVPNSIASGHANDSLGDTLTDYDADGINCHFCHSMVDPIYKAGVSPAEDVSILANLADVPQFYGNAAFVLDPTGTRRGPRADSSPPHELLHSPFHQSSDFCGTCHDVGNLATTRQADGTYKYNSIDKRSPTSDPWQMFPLERTYTEWKLSEFATSGVDMEGRFGGDGVTVVSTCQDCHMPRTSGKACSNGPVRPDLRRHDFAGAAAPILDLIAAQYADDPTVDPDLLDSIAVARSKAIQMLQLASSLDIEQECGSLRTRVINESGHKIPTGHIEGRRIWVNVRLFDADGDLVNEYGHYDYTEAHLDEDSTEIYEMHVGLSEFASEVTGYPAGPTGHMALADTIEKDNRIPPRGFNNDAFEAGGAPVVNHTYSDGQYWDDSWFTLSPDITTAEVFVYYQNTPRHYIEMLRDGNTTNDLGETLYDLWVETGKGMPIEMTSDTISISTFILGDLNCDGFVNVDDLLVVIRSWSMIDSPADMNGDRIVNLDDLLALLGHWSG